MKKSFYMLVIFAGTFTLNSYSQASTKLQPQLLQTYFELKDALVKSNAPLAAASATEFLKGINESDKKLLKADIRDILLKNAGEISQSKDLKFQREKFATLSTNMLNLAKTVKLSDAPVYQQYCPMKKASWLSDEKAIKNPYYGGAMLTCGSVILTL